VELGRAWWLDEAAAALGGEPAEAPPLEGDTRADVAIAGGGYTGLWTALALKAREPALDVVLLEAETCGHGPSGRNGGFLHGYWGALPRVSARFGREDALELCRAGEEIIPAVRSFCERRGADIWLREGGMLTVATTERQEAALSRELDLARGLGTSEECMPLDRDAVAARVASPVFRGAAFCRECATIQPARLALALRQAALNEGVRVHERSPVTRVLDGRVETARGRVAAKEVVVATGAWGSAWRPLRRHLTPFGSTIVLTEPVPELLAELGWTGGEAIVDARMFIHYFRTTPDGRVAMGSATGPIGFRGVDGRFGRDRASAETAAAGLRRLLPALAEARIDRAWGGPIDVSSDHLPFFGTVPRTRVHFGAGYTGNGAGPSWLGGQILASLALRLDDRWTALPLVGRAVPGLPPEPFRRVGGGIVRASVIAVERADEEGRRAPLPARLGAALPRLLGLRVGTR
jgi:glycine/D-amino acid oxidase-like deaminating enzyme